MTIYVNGEKYTFEAIQMSVQELTERLAFKEGFAVAVNMTFVRNTAYNETMIQDGDMVDILSPVQGG